MYWHVIIISLCALLLLVLVWKEIQRENKSWLWPRLVANILAIISLACLALPVEVNRSKQIENSSVAILLTDGYEKDSIQSFIKSHNNTKTYSLNKKRDAFGSTYVADFESFLADSLNNRVLHVFGFGLEKYDTDIFKDEVVVFHPQSINNLISSISWNQQLTSGEQLSVQGIIRNASKRSVKITLQAFDTNLDSATIDAGKLDFSFALGTFPKHIDKAIYKLIVTSGGDTLESNDLPVEVKYPTAIRVLVLAASPDFENKFLKNWLAEKQYSFALRTTISKNKFEKQFVNMAQTGLDRITSSLLDKFDLIIADVDALKGLPLSDAGAIRYTVENRGVGLIVKASVPERSSAFYLSSFPVTGGRDSVRHTLKLRIGLTDIPSPIRVEQPLYISNFPGTQTIVKDQQSRIVASSKMSGAGNIVVTSLAGSYSWWLAGKQEDYAAYWTALINKATKKNVSKMGWVGESGLSRVNNESVLSFQSDDHTTPKMQIGSNLLHPEQDFDLAYEWHGKYWPTSSGWQTLTNGDSIKSSRFVYESEDWQGIQAGQKIYWTNKIARNSVKSLQSNISLQGKVPVPKVLFFIAFLFFSGFLWFEKKYRNG